MLEDPIKYSEAWNFGPLDSASIPVELLVDKIIKFWGAGACHVDNRDQPHEANLLKLDLSKSNHKLGFSPKLSIDEALKMTVDWYKNFYSGASTPKDFTLKQIAKYNSL
jgi:CDP-glucose 4,6-dehydratase